MIESPGTEYLSAERLSAVRLSDVLRVPPGPADLASYDPGGTPGFDGDKKAGKSALRELSPIVSDLQERLYAESRGPIRRSVLLVLQGMDTSGKGGVLRHCVGLLDPQGISITSFKAPTNTERSHDFLWRIRKRLPSPGMIGVFDRSHYEDVLIAQVRHLASAKEITRRYAAINDFEAKLAISGTTVIKCVLHISREEQAARLLARLEDPSKHWKYNTGDIDERMRWDEYQQAYEAALEHCNSEVAPFFIVPADRKWYRNWAITSLLLEQLTAMKPQWPPADFDVAKEKERLAKT